MQKKSDEYAKDRVIQSRLLGPEQLMKYQVEGASEPSGLSGPVLQMLIHQREHWPMLSGGFENLASAKMRTVAFNGFEMKLQYNPGRIKSTTANVDRKSVQFRSCFLCHTNLPPEQKGVLYGDYLILGNPYPIFREHITIPHIDHIPQLIHPAFEALLDLTEAVGSQFLLFYNGPCCGASAPDHLHFQGGERGFMPLDNNWVDLADLHGEWVIRGDRFRAAKVDDGLRRFIVMESDDKRELVKRFNRLYGEFIKHHSPGQRPGIEMAGAEEPMLNILSSLEDRHWRVIVFLRRKHRPDRYYLDGDQRILFSPASVDFGGVCILPVEKDFNRLTPDDLVTMFQEVSATKRVLDKVAGAL